MRLIRFVKYSTLPLFILSLGCSKLTQDLSSSSPGTDSPRMYSDAFSTALIAEGLTAPQADAVMAAADSQVALLSLSKLSSKQVSSQESLGRLSDFGPLLIKGATEALQNNTVFTNEEEKIEGFEKIQCAYLSVLMQNASNHHSLKEVVKESSKQSVLKIAELSLSAEYLERIAKKLGSCAGIKLVGHNSGADLISAITEGSFEGLKGSELLDSYSEDLINAINTAVVRRIANSEDSDESKSTEVIRSIVNSIGELLEKIPGLNESERITFLKGILSQINSQINYEGKPELEDAIDYAGDDVREKYPTFPDNDEVKNFEPPLIISRHHIVTPVAAERCVLRQSNDFDWPFAITPTSEADCRNTCHFVRIRYGSGSEQRCIWDYNKVIATYDAALDLKAEHIKPSRCISRISSVNYPSSKMLTPAACNDFCSMKSSSLASFSGCYFASVPVATFDATGFTSTPITDWVPSSSGPTYDYDPGSQY